MMPVVRGNMEIHNYKSANNSIPSSRNRSRQGSTMSSLSTSPAVDSFLVGSPGGRKLILSSKSSRKSSHTSSTTSDRSLGQSGEDLPPKSPPVKTGSNTSINTFHNKLVSQLKKSLKISNKSESQDSEDNEQKTSS